MNRSATPRHGLRDRLVDTGLFLLAAAFGVLTAAERLDASSLAGPQWLFNLDQITGVLGCAALWLRRRRPVELALVLVALSTFSEMVAGAMLVALFTVAVHRTPRTTAAVFVLSLLAGVAFVVLRPDPDEPPFLLFLLGVAIQSAVVGWGLFIHYRRRLVLSLLDRAARAETETRLRVEQAQHRAREEIAREMHDVLGHRLSLLSVHAGALEYNPDAPSGDIARAAKVIRESAHQALQDLREVIGVLRAPVGELPQPTFADVPQLVAESSSAGMRVDLRDELTGTVPDQAGRTAYRIVQEALTNARKHAPGAEVRVHVAGEPEQGLAVEVRNTAPTTAPMPDAGAGQGLIGLAERVALAGGRLEYGPTAAGGWRLAAWLPWPP
ncbi:sensor histidine kinase [Streptosporangium sp. 'caverna']|uniref:sensor histidine kinase n=1 Tax=Streptosporangium sp. 'caverna' TaxID=2202249 RepID=UPI000D7E981C|nr:histidine kinase [Streptosporangium sp. 'caverna']AWS44206.1 sensor histidine kinase [Streptosporangium sp. 'caverna']